MEGVRMIRDYSGSYTVDRGSNKKKYVKRKKAVGSPSFLSFTKPMWKAIGAMLFVTLMITISSTFWYGWQIQLALDEIGSSTTAHQELTSLNLQLTSNRDMLLSQGHMEKAARKLGLYPPADNQLRYP